MAGRFLGGDPKVCRPGPDRIADMHTRFVRLSAMQPKSYTPRMAYWLDWLRYRFLGSGLGIIVLLLFIVASVMAFFFQSDVERKAQEGIPVFATITGMGFSVSKYRPGVMVGVSAKDDTGLMGSESVEAAFVAGCKVGDKIRAKRAGTQLILQPMPCR